jgi:hypothetical protein
MTWLLLLLGLGGSALVLHICRRADLGDFDEQLAVFGGEEPRC